VCVSLYLSVSHAELEPGGQTEWREVTAVYNSNQPIFQGHPDVMRPVVVEGTPIAVEGGAYSHGR
jgi:hypothetical protein